MSVRPIDMQMIMPKAMETSRTAAAENARPLNEQQQFAQHIQREAVHNQQSVIQTNRTEGQRVDRDGRGSSGGGGRRQKQRRGGAGEQQPEPDNREKKGLLDISV